MSVGAKVTFGAVRPPQRIAAAEENGVLQALPPTAYAILEQHLRRQEFAQGRVLWNAGDQPAQIYFPQSGLISMRMPTAEGYGIETGSVSREGVAGIQDAFDGGAAVVGIAQIGGVYTIVDSEVFFQAAQQNRAIAELAGLSRQWILWQAQHMAACNAAHSAEARLCRWLLVVSDRTENATVPVTQESIADALGLRRTTITLLTHSLETAGAIYNTRGKIKIRNRELLQNGGCSCCARLGWSNWPSNRLAALTRPVLYEMDSANSHEHRHQRGA
jgi:CRP-like cAMP-binding protein